MRLRGMQWKTGWKRRRPLAHQLPVTMRAFTEFFDDEMSWALWAYAQQLDSPVIGETRPYWAAMLAAARVPPVADTTGAYVTIPGVWRMYFAADYENPIAATSVSVEGFDSVGDAIEVADGIVIARAALFQVYPAEDSLDAICEVWIDGRLHKVSRSSFPVTATSGAVAVPAGSQQYLAGWCGGNAKLTRDEIDQWFRRTRAAAKVQSIPGKTLDLFSASAVPVGDAPASLTNLASGQDMDLVSENDPTITPKVADVNVVFNY